jgi:6-phosphogluconolactonase
MRIEVLEDAESAAARAASIIALQARQSAAANGGFTLAVSGGQTPAKMFRRLAQEDVPWNALQLLQVDERLAPPGHPDRNLLQIQNDLIAQVPLRPGNVHAMPVEETELDLAARRYASTLETVAGVPASIDLVHLGLGQDGHTASLVPGDPVLEVQDRDVAWTVIYQSRRRMTLTYPILNRSRLILWLVTGQDKRAMLNRLLVRDTSIPAGRVRQDRAIVVADRAATGEQ